MNSPLPLRPPFKVFSLRKLITVITFACSTIGGMLAAERPPNIVFFFADDQTTSTLGCYGHPFVQTPHIDALAARGTRFSQAMVSHSICWVSRTTILSGLTGRSYGTPGQRDLARAEAVEEYTDLLRKVVSMPVSLESGMQRCLKAFRQRIILMSTDPSAAILFTRNSLMAPVTKPISLSITPSPSWGASSRSALCHQSVVQCLSCRRWRSPTGDRAVSLAPVRQRSL